MVKVAAELEAEKIHALIDFAVSLAKVERRSFTSRRRLLSRSPPKRERSISFRSPPSK